MSNKFTYGILYEQKLLASILKDRLFFIDIYEILDGDYFSDEYNKYIYELILKYFYEYKQPPSLTYFKTEIEDLQKSEDYKKKLIETLKKVIIQQEETDLNYVKKTAKTFCQNQKMKKALYKSVDLLEESKFNEIFSLMKDAVSHSVSKNIGHKYKESIKKKYEENFRHTVETPWEAINEVLGGGVGSGELHVVAGLPGTGKSWFLVAIGAHAAKMGYNVLHYTLELDEDYVAFRYDANITGISTDKLDYQNKDDLVTEINGKVEGNIVIKSMQSYNTNTDDLEVHIDKLKLVEDFVPHIIIIDYPDLMTPTPNNKKRDSKEYQDIQTIYREIRGFARRMDIPAWGVSQINKKGLDDDYIQEDKLAASFGKLMEADFLMSFSKKAEDQWRKTARFMILKNRFGPDKLKYTGRFDSYTGNIDINFQGSIEDQETKSDELSGDENEKNMARQKYDELFGNK